VWLKYSIGLITDLGMPGTTSTYMCHGLYIAASRLNAFSPLLYVRHKEALVSSGHYIGLLYMFQLLPLFVMKMFSGSPGFSGLFLATLYGGSLRLQSASVFYFYAVL